MGLKHLAKISRTVFDTAHVSPQQRREALEHRFQSVASLTSISEPITAKLICYHLDKLRAARFAGTGATYERDHELILNSPLDDHIFLQLVVEGSVATSAEGKSFEALAGDIYVLDMARASTSKAGEGDYLSVLIPRSQLCGDDVDLHGLVLSRESLRCRMLTMHLEHLFEFLSQPYSQHSDYVIEVTLAIIRNCLQLRPPGETHREPWNDMLRQRILAYIDEHITDTSLDADMVRRAFRISRAHLYRLFPDYGGIKRYIRNKRLDAAFSDLTSDPYQRIGAIVERHGFTSERQFQRTFHERFEMAPSDLRSKGRMNARR
jgi:AraC-like DNA-binding protein